MKHHHGSRWAIRDFLGEIVERGEFSGSERAALNEAWELYAGVCEDLLRFLGLMPWTFDTPNLAERRESIARYHANRDEASDLLRAAAAKERDALERFRAVVEQD